MLDMRIPADFHETGHIYRTKTTDTPDIISCKVNKHDMFRSFFFIADKIEGQFGILFWSVPSSACPGDWNSSELFSFDADKHLRTGTYDRMPRKIQEIHVRTRIYFPEGPVKVNRFP